MTIPLSAVQDRTVAFRALQLGGRAAPDEFPLLMPGTWRGYIQGGAKKEFTITAEDIQAAYEYDQERRQRSPGRDLVLDYEHQTLAGTVAPAAAWFNLGVRDGVLYAVDVRWVERAKRMVEAGEYRYVSPVFQQYAVDKTTGRTYRMAVFNAALTNEPFLDELPPLILKGSGVTIFSHQSYSNREETMRYVGYTEAEADLKIAAAISEGRLSEFTRQPFRALALKSRVDFDELIATLAPGVHTAPNSPVTRQMSDALTDTDIEIARVLGLDKDEKYMTSLKGTRQSLTTMEAANNTNDARSSKVTDTDLVIAQALGLDPVLLANQKETDALVDQALREKKISPSSEAMWRSMAHSDVARFKAQMALREVNSAPSLVL